MQQVGNDRLAALKELDRRARATTDERRLRQIAAQRARIEADLRFFEEARGAK